MKNINCSLLADLPLFLQDWSKASGHQILCHINVQSHEQRILNLAHFIVILELELVVDHDLVDHYKSSVTSMIYDIFAIQPVCFTQK